MKSNAKFLTPVTYYTTKYVEVQPENLSLLIRRVRINNFFNLVVRLI